MSRSSHRRLLDRGRKAGVNAEELYRALASSRPSADDPVGKADSNGYVAQVNENGQRTYEQPTER